MTRKQPVQNCSRTAFFALPPRLEAQLQLLGQGQPSAYAIPPTRLAFAQVGGFAWDVQPSTQALRVGELTFVFSTPLAGVCYALTLGADTPPEAVGILEAVLENVALLRWAGGW